MPRFEVGDVVEYDRGEIADKAGFIRVVRATVQAVYPVQDDVLYTITYGGLGVATVREHKLEWMFDPMEPDHDALAREEPTSQYQDGVDSAEAR